MNHARSEVVKVRRCCILASSVPMNEIALSNPNSAWYAESHVGFGASVVPDAASFEFKPHLWRKYSTCPLCVLLVGKRARHPALNMSLVITFDVVNGRPWRCPLDAVQELGRRGTVFLIAVGQLLHIVSGVDAEDTAHV